MQTQLLKVVEDKESWVGWGLRQAKENPGKATAIALVAAPFAALEAGPAIIGSAAIAAGGVAWDWWTGSDRIEEVPMSKAQQLHDHEDHALAVDHIYARHPVRRARPMTVVPADIFHSQMIAEQMEHLASFLKAHVLLRRLRITVSSATGAKLDGKVSQSGRDMEIKAHANAAMHHELIYDEDEPRIVAYDAEPYWMAQFPEIRAAIANASRGSIQRTIARDTSFGLSASIAKQAGIDVDWLSKQLFRIEAAYG